MNDEKTEPEVDLEAVRKVTKDDVVHLMSVRYEDRVRERMKTLETEKRDVDAKKTGLLREIERRAKKLIEEDPRAKNFAEWVKGFLSLSSSVDLATIRTDVVVSVTAMFVVHGRTPTQGVPFVVEPGEDVFEAWADVKLDAFVMIGGKQKKVRGYGENEQHLDASTGSFHPAVDERLRDEAVLLQRRVREIEAEMRKLRDELVGLPRRKALLRAELTERALGATEEGKNFLTALGSVSALPTFDPAALATSPA